MVIQGLTPAAAKVIRALCVALCVACTGFLSGCSSFSGDSASLSQEQRASGEGSPATSDRTELARAADKYGAFATPGNSGYKIGPQDVLVRVTASGICHTDLNVINGLSALPLPIVPGHEGCGVVEEVGPVATFSRTTAGSSPCSTWK